MFINSNHDFPENEDQRAIDDKRDSKPMNLKILDDASKQLNNNEHGEDIGYQEIESHGNATALEDISQVEKDFSHAEHKRKNRYGDHHFDDDIGNLFEELHEIELNDERDGSMEEK